MSVSKEERRQAGGSTRLRCTGRRIVLVSGQTGLVAGRPDAPGGVTDCETLDDVTTEENDDVREDEVDDDRSGGQKP